jgi:putative peptide maturation system protein
MADDTIRELLPDIADTLTASHARRETPADLSARLAALGRARGIRVTLVSDAGSHLVRIERPDGGTLSVGYCPPDAEPWILLGSRSWSEREVLRVDGMPIDVADVIRFFDEMWRDRDILRRLVDVGLIRLECRRLALEVGDDELQDALDAVRRGLGLHTAEVTHAWLRERGLDHAALEAYAHDHALVRKLRDTVVPRERDDDADRLFDQYLADRRSSATVEWFWGNEARTDR